MIPLYVDKDSLIINLFDWASDFVGWERNNIKCGVQRQKNCSDFGVHGVQIDWLGLTISTQKSVLKNMHHVPRCYPKSVKNRPSKPNLQNLIHFDR